MSRLTESEIHGLFEFTLKKYVRYKDVQVELVDHLASAIEELREKNPDIGFTKALYQVYEGFGIFGFAKIIEAKEKALVKYWLRKVFKMVLGYFKPPLVFGTVGCMILLFQLLHSGILPLKYLFFIATAAFIVSAILTISHQYIREEAMNEYLYMKAFYSVSYSMLAFAFYSSYFMDDLFFWMTAWHPNLQIVLASFITPLACILIYLVTFKIPGMLKREFNEKYKHILTVS
ncbi:MAG: hypothetical protein HKN68_02130 [Saprospiraceae bacterium]|nr:hypothetical protein [Saprospiraceae bacterium]